MKVAHFKLSLLLVMFVLSNLVIAQTKTNSINSQFADEWNIYYEDDKIAIETRALDITDPMKSSNYEILAFKYINKTAQPISIQFLRRLIYTNGCTDCDEAEVEVIIPLMALESLEYHDYPHNKDYYVYSKDLTGSVNEVLVSYLLEDIRVVY